MAKRSLDDRMAIGDEAARLLDDPMFNSLLNSITADYMNELMNTVPGSSSGVQAHAGIRGLNDIKSRLTALRNDAAMARKEVENENKKQGKG